MRRFPDFLEAFLEYSDDSFVPPQFNLWAGLSIVAGALERRVWLPWGPDYSFYPNIYVMLVSLPGDGKSVALNRAVNLLMDANRVTSMLNIMPNQVTEAKFIELMQAGRSFIETRGDKEIIHRQNAGYYWASEASNSLKNVFGDFLACLTDFYDCPKIWKRATKKDGKEIVLHNVCMNVLAGTTFDYLGKLVNDENIMGGFASRMIYVKSENKKVKPQLFQLGATEDDEERAKYREALIEDLTAITKMIGPFRASPEFGEAWQAWYPEFEKKRRTIESEKTQSILARTNPNLLKVAMLLSASESDDRILKINHWEKALKLIMEIQNDAPRTFRQARANSSEVSSSNLKNTVISVVENNKGLLLNELKSRVIARGYSERSVSSMIEALITSKVIGYSEARAGGSPLTLIGNPDNYL